VTCPNFTAQEAQLRMFRKNAFAFIIVSICGLVAAASTYAQSAAKLTDVQVKRNASGVAVDLSFDRPVAAKSLKPGFERNFVQIVLKATKIDAAQILPVSESEISKVFAYPYTQDTARLRIILKSDNKWAKGRVSVWNNSPKVVRVFIKDQKGAGATTEVSEAPPAPKAVAKVENKTEVKVEAKAETKDNAEEATLLREVVANTKEIDINNPESVKAALRPDSEEARGQSVGIKAEPSKHFARMVIALFAVVGLFVGAVFLLKKYSSKLKKLPFGKKERLIQVVATHYLGNKKSISMVKIAGEYMVVGVGNEGISLISKLGPEVNVETYLEDRFWGGTFEKHLSTYSKDPAVSKEVEFDGATPAIESLKYDGTRDIPRTAKVVDKVELSPVRASIKEKLTKLKPLA
jgi:flagellar biosynthetic protein FliO